MYVLGQCCPNLLLQLKYIRSVDEQQSRYSSGADHRQGNLAGLTAAMLLQALQSRHSKGSI